VDVVKWVTYTMTTEDHQKTLGGGGLGRCAEYRVSGLGFSTQFMTRKTTSSDQRKAFSSSYSLG